MKMRKLLAVVLAVTLAISAMAISVFADEVVEVEMYNYTTSTTKSATYTWTVPAYALYGYASQGDYLVLSLPTSLAADVATTTTEETTTITGYSYTDSTTGTVTTITVDTYEADPDSYTEYTAVEETTETTTTTVAPAGTYPISYTLTVNGVTVNLKGSDGSAYGLFTQTVDVSTYARHYSSSANGSSEGGWSEVNATIPQSTMVQDNTPITITATVTGFSSISDLAESWEFAAEWWPSWSASVYDADGNYVEYGYGVYVSYYDEDNTLVGTAYAANGMTCSGPTDTSSSSQKNVIIIADTTADTTIAAAEGVNALLYWDHTLANRNTMLLAANTEGATAKLVIELADSIYGYAVYTLTSNIEAYASNTYTYDSSYWYGTTTGVGIDELYGYVVDTYVLSGETVNTLEFDVDVSLLYNAIYGLYNGNMYVTQVITGTSDGISTKYYTNSSTYALEATRVYLEVSFPADDDTVVDNEDPVEDTNSETEDDELTVDDTDDTTEPETNPTTGIVLALVPMAVAAAAAVASKRR